MKHKFATNNDRNHFIENSAPSKRYLLIGDYCVNCDRRIWDQELLDFLNISFLEKYNMTITHYLREKECMDSLEETLKIFDELWPCLTDEEFVIKNILK